MNENEKTAVLELLRDARRLIARPKGWIKGVYSRLVPEKDYDCYCAMGALNEVAKSNSLGPVAQRRAMSLLASVISGRSVERFAVQGGLAHVVITSYNDEKTTRKRDVLATFDAAIASLEQ